MLCKVLVQQQLSSNIWVSSKTTGCLSCKEDGIVAEYIGTENQCHFLGDQYIKDLGLLAFNIYSQLSYTLSNLHSDKTWAVSLYTLSANKNSSINLCALPSKARTGTQYVSGLEWQLRSVITSGFYVFPDRLSISLCLPITRYEALTLHWVTWATASVYSLSSPLLPCLWRFKPFH